MAVWMVEQMYDEYLAKCEDKGVEAKAMKDWYELEVKEW